MLQLSDEAKRLTSTFLAYRNDIDIYTEDENKDREFYKVLIKRLIRNDIVINDITPLGPKDVVVKRCQNEPDNGRKKIFIIDGDVTIIHGKGVLSMKNLFVLDAYCIENFLFDKETLIHFIYLNCATKAKEQISDELEFETWLSGFQEYFIELFIHFAIADYFELYYTLFNANKYHVKMKNGYNFSPEIIQQDIENIKKEILGKIKEKDYQDKHDELKDQWTSCINSLFTIVSGKDYLIPILLIKTQQFKVSQATPSLEEVKMALVQYSNLDRLQKLKTAIEAL